MKLKNTLLGCLLVTSLSIPIATTGCSYNHYYTMEMKFFEFMELEQDACPVVFNWYADFSNETSLEAGRHLQSIYNAEFVCWASLPTMQTAILRILFAFLPIIEKFYDIDKLENADIIETIGITSNGYVSCVDVTIHQHDEFGEFYMHIFNPTNFFVYSSNITSNTCEGQFTQDGKTVDTPLLKMNCMFTNNEKIKIFYTDDVAMSLLWNHSMTPNFLPQ